MDVKKIEVWLNFLFTDVCLPNKFVLLWICLQLSHNLMACFCRSVRSPFKHHCNIYLLIFTITTTITITLLSSGWKKDPKNGLFHTEKLYGGWLKNKLKYAKCAD